MQNNAYISFLSFSFKVPTFKKGGNWNFEKTSHSFLNLNFSIFFSMSIMVVCILHEW